MKKERIAWKPDHLPAWEGLRLLLLGLLVVVALFVALAGSCGPLVGMIALALVVAKLLAAFLAWVDRGDPGAPPPPSTRRKKPGGGSGPSGGAPVFSSLRPRPVLGAAAAKELPLGEGK